MTLRQLFLSHRGKLTDKWELYLRVYERLFEPYKDKEIAILEIGVQNGGSLDIWAKYFHKARYIIGCDIDERCSKLKYDDPRIKIIIGDIKDDATIERIKAITDNLDVIIDDGSHHSEDIIKAFIKLFPLLRDGGIYVIEDLHTVYHKRFGGGLLAPHSAMEFLKRLVDVLNYEAWGGSLSREELLKSFWDNYEVVLPEDMLARIHSIQFFNSLCVIYKDRVERNLLGRRLTVGDEAEVISLSEGIHKTLSELLPNKPSDYVDAAKLLKENQELRLQLQAQRRELESLKAQLKEIRESISWKLIAPLRWLERKLKR